MRAKSISDLLKPKSIEEVKTALKEHKIGSFNLYRFVYELWDKPFKTKELLRDIVHNKLKLNLKDMEIAMLYKFPLLESSFEKILNSSEAESSLIGEINGYYVNYNDLNPIKNQYGEIIEFPNFYFIFSKKYKIIKFVSPARMSSGEYYAFPKDLNLGEIIYADI